jgi:hypothetical protein
MMEEEEKPNTFRKIVGIILVMIVILMTIVYWFIPLNSITFEMRTSESTNFSLSPYGVEGMQFYSNLRYVDENITYNIMEDCTLQKKADMTLALEILENETMLKFQEVLSNEEISITCSGNNKISGDFFVAGEGGPTNITKTDNFNVISTGKILLIKESSCSQPNVALHEALHALGFDHSSNTNNIMYNYSRCTHTMGQDIPQLINELYSVPPLVDLALENISATMNGQYMDTNVTIRNHGLKKSKLAKLEIYAGDKLVKEVDVNPMEIGGGRMIVLTSNWIAKSNFDKLKYVIVSTEEELFTENNQVILSIS